MTDPTHEIDGLVPRDTEGTPHCFYCGLLVSSKARIEYDHFPVPRVLGGNRTVPSCQSCHDLKDRKPLVDWPLETYAGAMAELVAAGPYARILLAKCLTIAMRAEMEASDSWFDSPDSVRDANRFASTERGHA